MNLSVRWIYPQPIEASDVYRRLGRDWRCPWCDSEHVAAKETKLVVPSRWVELPIRSSEPGWVCEGCVIEVYNACNSDEFERHFDRKLVEYAAAVEGVEVAVFRRKCLEHQIAMLLEEGLYKNGTPEERRECGRLLGRLQRLLRADAPPSSK